MRGPDDRLHAVARLDAQRAPERGHFETLCGHHLPVDTKQPDQPRQLCPACLVAAVPDLRAIGPAWDSLTS
ncbi:MAG TPA: hypothetical protein VHC18_07925 [Amycolatopsis sp.]|nr:hypothetical protein [Amycolatopsis sp.]